MEQKMRLEHVRKIELVWREFREIHGLIEEFYQACKEAVGANSLPSVNEYTARCSSDTMAVEMKRIAETILGFFDTEMMNPDALVLIKMMNPEMRKELAPAFLQTSIIFWPWHQYVFWALGKKQDVDLELFLEHTPDCLRSSYGKFLRSFWPRP